MESFVHAHVAPVLYLAQRDACNVFASRGLVTFEGHAEIFKHAIEVCASTLVHVAERLTDVDPLTRPVWERELGDVTL